MTWEQQKELARKVREAADAQGILQKEIATAAGTSSGNMSYAMACKSRMSDEKWQLACEYVGVDYDSVMGGEPVAAEEKERHREEHEEAERPKKLRIMALEGEFFEYRLKGELVELISNALTVQIQPGMVKDLCEEITQACAMLTKA